MNNIENNKLIRTFMELQPKLVAPDVYSYNDGIFFTSRGSLEEVSKGMDRYVKYHSDWNWLMDVINRIESLKITFIIHSEFVKLILSDTGEVLTIQKVEDKIEAVYNACISFIHWYNQQSK